jgi:serine/threonine-protein kinase RsbT
VTIIVDAKALELIESFAIRTRSDPPPMARLRPDGAGNRQDVLKRPAAAAVTEVPTTSVDAMVAIHTEIDIVAARQQGRTLARRLGFSTTEATLVATAISELARNIILYAERGSILVKLLEENGRRGILVVACDQGPGIADLRRAMTGGYSTSGGLGLGLCGVRRLVDDFDITSEVGRGTTVTVTKWKG